VAIKVWPIAVHLFLHIGNFGMAK